MMYRFNNDPQFIQKWVLSDGATFCLNDTGINILGKAPNENKNRCVWCCSLMRYAVFTEFVSTFTCSLYNACYCRLSRLFARILFYFSFFFVLEESTESEKNNELKWEHFFYENWERNVGLNDIRRMFVNIDNYLSSTPNVICDSLGWTQNLGGYKRRTHS